MKNLSEMQIKVWDYFKFQDQKHNSQVVIQDQVFAAKCLYCGDSLTDSDVEDVAAVYYKGRI